MPKFNYQNVLPEKKHIVDKESLTMFNAGILGQIMAKKMETNTEFGVSSFYLKDP